MRALFFIFTLFTSILYAEDEIYVQLDQEVPLLPIYVSPIDAGASSFSKEFQKNIRDILVFDLHHNGMTKVLTDDEIASKQSLKDQTSFDATPPFSKLKQDQVLYLIKLALKENELTAKVISVNSQSFKTISGIELTQNLAQNLAQDRTKIHKLSDTIFELLFGKKGIATSHILYTIKKKIEGPRGEPLYVSEVYEADYDGHNEQMLTRDNSYIAHPQYVPAPHDQKSSWFLYVSYKIGQPKLYAAPLAAPLKGGSAQRLSSLRGIQVTPGISKDAKAFAFSSDITGKADLFYQTLTGDTESKPQQIFAAKGAANASPTFSPDGTQIAFVSNKDGTPKIYVMKIPKPNTRLSDVHAALITKKCRENTAPSWSPDGKKITYCARNSGDRQIWVYDFETNQEKELTQGKGTKENPTWAKDSLHILFNASDGVQTDLYLINLNQPEAVKITKGPGDKMFPCWEPK